MPIAPFDTIVARQRYRPFGEPRASSAGRLIMAGAPGAGVGYCDRVTARRQALVIGEPERPLSR